MSALNCCQSVESVRNTFYTSKYNYVIIYNFRNLSQGAENDWCSSQGKTPPSGLQRKAGLEDELDICL
jgi:hypothetical protein